MKNIFLHKIKKRSKSTRTLAPPDLGTLIETIIIYWLKFFISDEEQFLILQYFCLLCICDTLNTGVQTGKDHSRVHHHLELYVSLTQGCIEFFYWVVLPCLIYFFLSIRVGCILYYIMETWHTVSRTWEFGARVALKPRSSIYIRSIKLFSITNLDVFTVKKHSTGALRFALFFRNLKWLQKTSIRTATSSKLFRSNIRIKS